MPAKGYRRTIPSSPGDAVKLRTVWMRDSDWAYLRERYKNAANGIRTLITADRRAYEDKTFNR